MSGKSSKTYRDIWFCIRHAYEHAIIAHKELTVFYSNGCLLTVVFMVMVV